MDNTELNRLSDKLYTQAIADIERSNIVGIVRELNYCISILTELACENNKTQEWVARHKAIQVYVTKLNELVLK